MILPDFRIRSLCESGMVEPFSSALLNPASLDVRLGSSLLIEDPFSPELVHYDLEPHSEANPYLLQPSHFVLGQTLERFNIPSGIAAEFKLKSSRAREGIEHLLAGFADPGFNNSVMTLELVNARKYHPVKLWSGMKIGQMIFYTMLETPLIDYSVKGHYNGDLVVTASKGHL